MIRFKAPLFSIVVLSVSVAACSDAGKSSEFVCDETSNFKVQIGWHEFLIPRGLQPNLYPAEVGKDRFSEAELCQAAGASPLELRSFSFSFQDNAADNVPSELGGIVDQISPVQLIIQKRPAVDRPVSLGFLLGDLQEEGTSYESLVFENSLYCFHPTEADSIKCISGPEFLSPLGNPIAYRCGKQSNAYRDEKVVSIGRLCSGNYFLSADLMLTIRVYDKVQPRERWRVLDASIRDFLSLIESSDPRKELKDVIYAE